MTQAVDHDVDVDVDVALTLGVGAFLYREARLIDERRFDEWLSLYSADAVYTVPQEATSDPAHRVSIIHDNKRRLEERILRLGSGFAYSQEPASRTIHLVSNVQVEPGSDRDVVEVLSALLVVETRRGRQSVHAGPVTHRLRRHERGFVIDEKRISLVGSDLPLGNLTFLL